MFMFIIISVVQKSKKMTKKTIILIIVGNQRCRTCPSSSLYSDATHKICPRSGRKISCTKKTIAIGNIAIAISIAISIVY